MLAGIVCYTVPCCDVEAIVSEDIDGYKSRWMVDPVNLYLALGTTSTRSWFVIDDVVVVVVIRVVWFLLLSDLWNI